MSDSTRELLYAISDQQGRQWAFPKNGRGRGLAIYQPSSLKGCVLRAGLAVAPRAIVPMILRSCALRDLVGPEIEAFLIERFRPPEYAFSVFMGTPSPHQKATIQVFTRDRIVAYCKVSQSAAVGALFREESALLSHLHASGVANVPRPLGIEEVGRAHVFLQDTRKAFGSPVPHRLGASHFEFAECLASRTRSRVSFEETDFHKILCGGRELSSMLPPHAQELFESALQSTMDRLSADTCFCVGHRDFAPWNTCLTPSGLFVFDFEYGRKSYPMHMDLHGFLVSVGMLKYRWDGPRIRREHERLFGGHGEVLLTGCLVDKISHYLLRGGEDDVQIAASYCDVLMCARGDR